jgi:hypothetical protein
MDENKLVVLSSNVKSFYEQNTIANFKSKLSSNMSFPDDWEVGINFISYNLSWYNLSSKQKITLSCFDEGREKIIDLEIYVNTGKYDTIELLIFEINTQLTKFHDLLKFSVFPELYVNELTRIIELKNGISEASGKLIFVTFTDELCLMLGLDKVKMDNIKDEKMTFYQNALANTDLTDLLTTELTESEKWIFGDHPYDISGGNYSLFVYSDIVKPTHVGDSFTQFLGLVEIPNDIAFGKQVVIKYSNPIYVPLLLNEFDTIEIDIKNDSGETIPFNFGRVHIILHFRKVNKKINDILF